ncbi:dienelactone hydrolase family protein [Neisseria leonii]|uniref:dienelactone hydrolase family protein n=1 Tax=Neisseria leonii TaxID=2995413 RepID=UPI00237A0A7D|nr:dienelactone hydrolase family protein [Neisseria sp. 3986]MDD9326460.1 dienelactone hydrolase family protein [Neisseria sp. 3986]
MENRIITETLSYTDSQGVTLHSHFCRPADAAAELSGVLVAPEWWGLSGHAKRAAERLAEAGYAALAADLYGGARLTDDAAVAAAEMNYLLDNPAVLEERTRLAYETLAARPEVNALSLGAAGFCFGGKVVLDMARRGADLKAVAAFHAVLAAQQPAVAGMVKAELLVAHGELDSMVTLDDVAAFREEMAAADVRCRIDILPGARHGFTNPQATENGRKNGADLEYNEAAAETAWQNMLNLFGRCL